MKRRFVVFVATCASASLLRADFTYEQTTKMTGGAMAQMMRVAGAFSRQLREPVKNTVIVKGNRMVTLSADSAHIIDLDKETITDVDFKKKTYSVLTFAQMAEAMKQAAAKMQDATAQAQAQTADQPKPEMDFKMDVKDTGQSKVINGLNAKQFILTFEMEGTDPKTGQKASTVVTADTWSAPSIPGYDEVKNFYMRMGQKMAWTPGAFGMAQPQLARGMAQVSKQTAKIEGVPVLQITRMSLKGDGMDQMQAAQAAQAQQQQQQAQQQPPPNVSGAAQEAAAGAATSAALGRLGRTGGVLGGLGGFGRGRKKQEKQPEQQQQPPQQQQAPQGAPPSGDATPGLLSEMTMELTSFSSGPADASKLDVPAGFKQVENEMIKALRR